METNQVTFTDEELHCLARIFQKNLFPPDDNEIRTFSQCDYCKYSDVCFKVQRQESDPQSSYFSSVRQKLASSTHVHLVRFMNETTEQLYLHESFQLLYPKKYKQMLLKMKLEKPKWYENHISDLKEKHPIGYGYAIGLLALED